MKKSSEKVPASSVQQPESIENKTVQVNPCEPGHQTVPEPTSNINNCVGGGGGASANNPNQTSTSASTKIPSFFTEENNDLSNLRFKLQSSLQPPPPFNNKDNHMPINDTSKRAPAGGAGANNSNHTSLPMHNTNQFAAEGNQYTIKTPTFFQSPLSGLHNFSLMPNDTNCGAIGGNAGENDLNHNPMP